MGIDRERKGERTGIGREGGVVAGNKIPIRRRDGKGRT